MVDVCFAARQMGFLDAKECPQLGKLAYQYLKKSKGCESSIYEFFDGEEDAESLYAKLIEELDICILTYFAFHWTQVSHMISQVSACGCELAINNNSSKHILFHSF